MAPDEESEVLLARLLETWATEREVDLRAIYVAGAAADDCYALGPLAGGVAGIVIGRDLAAYARLGIREAWQWAPDARVSVQELQDGQYRDRSDGRSGVLPDLDLSRLARFVRPGESHTRLVKAYRETF